MFPTLDPKNQPTLTNAPVSLTKAPVSLTKAPVSWIDQFASLAGLCKNGTCAPTLSPSPTDLPTASPSISTQPTVSPTVFPSSSPSISPTSVPSSSPTVSSKPSAAPIPYARAERNDIRYKQWAELSVQEMNLVEQLDYTAATWNQIGTNPIENLDWQRLSRPQKQVAQQLNYTLGSWDCWQNHFQSYRWIDLDDEYTQSGQWWKALGWDIYSWNRNTDEPASDSRTWYELSEEERDAASELCYSRILWDEGDVTYDGGTSFPMTKPNFRYGHWYTLDEAQRAAADDMLKYSSLNWNVLGLNDKIEGQRWGELTDYERLGATSLGYTMLTWDCWQNHFRSYEWYDLHFYGLDFPYVKLGWNEKSWEGIEDPPATMDKSWFELTSDERKAASEVCYFAENWDEVDMTPNLGIFPFPKVKQRYVEWTVLPGAIRRSARGSLLYNKTTWNEIGTSEVENKCWTELSEVQQSDAIDLGFYQRTWDCFHCHYRTYNWNDIDEDSRDSLQILGWSEESWLADEVPPSYENEWDRLSEDEQAVMPTLCFFEDNWNKANLETIVNTAIAGVKEDGTAIVVEVVGVTDEGDAIYGNEVLGETEDGEPIYGEAIPGITGDTFGGTFGGNFGQPPGPAPEVIAPAPVSSAARSGKRMTCIVTVLVGSFIPLLL